MLVLRGACSSDSRFVAAGAGGVERTGAVVVVGLMIGAGADAGAGAGADTRT